MFSKMYKLFCIAPLENTSVCHEIVCVFFAKIIYYNVYVKKKKTLGRRETVKVQRTNFQSTEHESVGAFALPCLFKVNT